jgi:hypothetical protein
MIGSTLTSTADVNAGRRRKSLTISRRQKRGSSSFLQLIAMMMLLLSSMTMILFVSAIKPVRNIQVTFRGQTYTVREPVTTVKELTEKFEKISGKKKTPSPSEASLNNSNKNDDDSNKNKKKGMIIWKGQILKPDDSLIKAGIKNGDHVMILPDEKETKATDMLAVYLFLLSSNEKAIEDAITKIKQEQPESFEQMEEMFHSLRDNIQHLKKQDVVDNLRTNFDLAYHRIRSMWEHPSLRQSLHDPERIENYRKIISQNLSRTKFLNSNKQGGSSSNNNRLQNAINSPEIWKKEFTKFVAKAIRVGDTILEGILDLLLDVLKGKGSSSSNANRNNSYYSTSSQHQQDGAAGMSSSSSSWTSAAANAHTTLADTYTDEMEDPSLANNLLFELSESEDDYEDE